jgi:hypothetical protein
MKRAILLFSFVFSLLTTKAQDTKLNQNSIFELSKLNEKEFKNFINTSNLELIIDNKLNFITGKSSNGFTTYSKKIDAKNEDPDLVFSSKENQDQILLLGFKLINEEGIVKEYENELYFITTLHSEDLGNGIMWYRYFIQYKPLHKTN